VGKIAQALEISSGKDRGQATANQGGIQIEPLKRTPEVNSNYLDDEFKAALEDELMPSAYVPPSPQKPAEPASATRVPAVEDFPTIGQAAAQSGSATQRPVSQAQREGSPMSLLQKLKHGFGAKEHHEPARHEPESEQPQAREAREVSVNRTAPRVDGNPYAPRQERAESPQGNIDQTGRVTPATRPINDDDQLDIPAFLRRQAN
jgi:cell division protein FtsZ